MATDNDIVLIYFDETPLVFARIEEILPDNKPDWYHVKLLMLQVPLQIVRWILKDEYINGAQFTMNGRQIRMERVICPQSAPSEMKKNERKKPSSKSSGAKVISLADLKKK